MSKSWKYHFDIVLAMATTMQIAFYGILFNQGADPILLTKFLLSVTFGLIVGLMLQIIKVVLVREKWMVKDDGP